MHSNKNTLEEKACKLFLGLYNKNVSFLSLGNPQLKEPDCLCSENIGIEIVGVYDNTYQATRLNNDARGNQLRHAPNPEYHLLSLSNLETAIVNKLQKLGNGNYDGFQGKLFLLCYLASPLIESHEIENFIKSFVPFRKETFFERFFDETWLLWKAENNGDYKIAFLE